MSLFSTPKAPQPDPAVVAQQQRAQQQADNDLTSQIQMDLQQRTRARLQQYGLLPTGGGVTPAGPFAGVRSALAGPGGLPRAS
jgi:hypothetical protein